jgi:hypothetical protein
VAAPFEPPVSVFVAENIAVASEIIFGKFANPVGRDEGLGSGMLAGHEHD